MNAFDLNKTKLGKRPFFCLLILILLAGILKTAVAASDNTLSLPDPSDESGAPSLALDSNGYPVISYVISNPASNNHLNIMHCNDPYCLDGDESIVTVDNDALLSALVLDSNGYPVVAYADFSGVSGIRLLHCNDPNCAGGNENITVVDDIHTPISQIALVLDSNGYPVISFTAPTPANVNNHDLIVIHCNDANCLGGDESKEVVDIAIGAGSSLFYDVALMLDSSGNPVISYHDAAQKDLKLVHCNDPNCAGADESIVTLASTGNVGAASDLMLDSSGNPLISYVDETANTLRLIRCNDANCVGDDEYQVTVTKNADIYDLTLALKSNNHPVIVGNGSQLVFVYCNDPDCAGANETITRMSDSALIGSMMLDSNDHPVVSYSFNGSGAPTIAVLHCADPACSISPTIDSDLDGQTNGDETTCGSDPLDDTSLSPDIDGDDIPDCVDPINDLFASCDIASGFNVIHGTPGNDKLRGTAENDIIFGYGGNDRIEGLGGHDCLVGGDGNDQLFGGDGDDIAWGGDVDNVTTYDRDNDKLYGGNGDDYLDGGDGNDTLTANHGDDILWGGANNDRLDGGHGNDELFGQEGNDRLYGSRGDDKLLGGAGIDYIDGSSGEDYCSGETLRSCEQLIP